MTTRLVGGALMALGVAIAVLPTFTWFSGPPAAAPTHVSGFGGAGQLWLMPVLGTLIVIAGVAFVRCRPGTGRAVARRVGPPAFMAALAAFGFAVWAAVDSDLTLRITLAAGTEVVAVTTSLAPAGIAALIAAGTSAAIAAVATAVGGRRR